MAPSPLDPRDALVDALLAEAQRAESAGQREVARRRYESALYLIGTPERARESSRILRRVGWLYLLDGELEIGLDTLGAALAVAECHGDESSVAHATNAIAIGHWQRGDLDEAERLYREAARRARDAGEAQLEAMVEQNLGIIAGIRGDIPAALRHYEASLARYRALGLSDYVGKVLANIGMAHADHENWEAAERTYEEALAHCRAHGDVTTSLMVRANLAETLIGRRDFQRAQLVCEEVLREARTLGDTRALAEVHKHNGVIARELGRVEESEEFLRLAFEGAQSREDLLLAAETAREQAELYTMLHRNRETLQSLSTSHRLFSRLRAQRDLADVTRRLGRLESRFEALVRRWALSIESKDRYTYGHCERVADYACALARELGMDEPTLFWFRIGALLHDVGKIVVPSDVLNKNGPLTPEERAIMERHPDAGVELIRDVELPWDVLPMVRSHHERWDGKGYPQRLAGEDIPYVARILGVADVFDALTTDRPYRKAFSHEEALVMMRADSGRAFDPQILDAFLRIAPRLQDAPPALRLVS